MGMACAAPFDADTMYAEVTRAAPYASLVRSDFDDVLRFVADGGYALGGYERYRRLTRTEGGRYRPASPRVVQRYRMNIGTIVEAVMLKVRLRRGPVLGEIERSDEHTSELQSLMRISYAVFCLKKKKIT